MTTLAPGTTTGTSRTQVKSKPKPAYSYIFITGIIPFLVAVKRIIYE